MKILMVAPEPVFEPRGTPFSVIYRAKALSELGHSVDLLTYHIGRDVNIKNLKFYRIPKIPFFKKIRVGPSFGKIFLDIFLFYKTLSFMLKKRYDAVHSHEEASFWCVLLCRLFRVPHVYDMHSSLPQQLHNFGFMNCFIIRSIFNALEKLVIINSRSVITICRDLYDTAVSIGGKADIVNIENIFDNSLIFDDDPAEVEKYRPLLKDRLIVLYYGTMEKYQGIDLLIESFNIAAEKNRDLYLILIGGRDDQIKHYSRYARDKNRVLFIPPVYPGQLKPFVDIADILITTRIRGTNTPLKLYGYIRAGKPIIATNIYSHTQVLDENTALLCSPDPESIAGAISELIRNKTLCHDLSTGCLIVSKEKYRPEEYIQNVRTAYKSIS